MREVLITWNPSLYEAYEVYEALLDETARPVRPEGRRSGRGGERPDRRRALERAGVGAAGHTRL
ncbi:hypothetical protein [Streptomyces sp. NPDC020965]|uniref:hypothetical protein n=1 Tax=Streptomyces sp. NPDC020965 TaxID=3365105 RepID=UPI0037930849